jgi:hypothetical protein
MWAVFKTDKTTGFKIDNYTYGSPLSILHNNLYLSSSRDKNLVDFYFTDDNNGKQKWIIEESVDNDSTVHIGASKPNKYGEKYLGAPNSDNIVFMYTSKTKHTKWKITKAENNTYNVIYVGEKFNPITHTIVVARYMENLDWAIPYKDRVIVYNKGTPLNLPFDHIIQTENVGREGHTYLKYMIDNYHCLPSRISFLQGDPIPHNETLLYGLENYDKFIGFQGLSLRYLKEIQIPRDDFIDRYKTVTPYGFQYAVYLVDRNMRMDFYDIGVEDQVKRYLLQNNVKSNQVFSMFDNFLFRVKFHRKKVDPIIAMVLCGLFSVSSENIRLNTVDDYKNIMKELLTFHQHGGIEGYILERLWLWLLV